MINSASLLHPDAFLSPLAIDEAVQRALNEDLGRAGDITSMATIPEATHAHAGGHRQEAADGNQHRCFVPRGHGGRGYDGEPAVANANPRWRYRRER